MKETQRLEELDSLRGIASLSVVLYHSTSLLGIAAALPFLYNSPLQFLLSGHQAVIFFFLLSGFVLSLPYVAGHPYGYKKFLIRRLCRLYPTYIAAVAFGLVMRLLVNRVPISNLWSRPIGIIPILQHVVLIDQFHQQYFDPVVWSLVMEMRIALVFPLLIWFVLRVNWRWTLLAGVLLSISGIYLHVMYQNSISFFTNYFDTAHYALMFITGAILAKHRTDLIEYFQFRHVITRLFWGVVAFVIYTWGNPVGWSEGGLAGDLVSDWFTMLAAGYFIIAALGSVWLRAFLHWRPILFVGRVSYSLYLVHLVVLLTLMNLAIDPLSVEYPGAVSTYYVSPYWVLAGTVVISLCLAALSYRYIELPSIHLGRYLTRMREYKKTADRRSLPAE